MTNYEKMRKYETNEVDFINAVKDTFPVYGNVPTQKELSDFCIDVCNNFGIDTDRAIRIAESNVVFVLTL